MKKILPAFFGLCALSLLAVSLFHVFFSHFDKPQIRQKYYAGQVVELKLVTSSGNDVYAVVGGVSSNAVLIYLYSPTGGILTQTVSPLILK